MKVHSPLELFAYRLGSAMTMENDSLMMLGELASVSTLPQVTEMFTHHSDETKQQIANLREAFTAAGLELKEKPSPTTKGLAQEGQSLLDKADETLVDVVAVAAAGGTEHFEIASYRSLITMADSLDMRQVVDLLRENLNQEEHTAKELEKMAVELVREFGMART